jgi:hypothetical protein
MVRGPACSTSWLWLIKPNELLATFMFGSARLRILNAEQAQGPPHDTQEMGFPDTACVVYRISQGAYADIFTTVWGTQAFTIGWPAETEKICGTPGGAFGTNIAPLALKAEDRGKANTAMINTRSPLLRMRHRQM